MSDQRNDTPDESAQSETSAPSDQTRAQGETQASPASAEQAAGGADVRGATRPEESGAESPQAGNGKAEKDELQGRIAKLEADKARLEQEKQDNWDRFLRATADLENFRKRTRREVDDARFEARQRVLKEMLPVIDNLERAVEHATKSGQAKAVEAGVLEGVQLVLRQFAQALERCEVVAVDALGKPFDPNVHEAISQVETGEYPPGSVAQVLQKGYRSGDRLLRPALVVVAKAPPAPPSPEGSSEPSADPSSEPPGSAPEGVGLGTNEA